MIRHEISKLRQGFGQRSANRRRGRRTGRRRPSPARPATTPAWPRAGAATRPRLP